MRAHLLLPLYIPPFHQENHHAFFTPRLTRGNPLGVVLGIYSLHPSLTRGERNWNRNDLRVVTARVFLRPQVFFYVHL